MLGIPLFNIQVKPCNLLAHFDAEWAGLELIQRQLFTCRIDLFLIWYMNSEAQYKAKRLEFG